ncbi:KilA-N domain-containing protein [Nostoc punctiforme]|uniref:KilA/APSES-type HTH DNA-binding domain-containing protein n=1 Tax=Nostoc punctiforme (strain ATCC 29133 / PCC 73102) TaxID=63737 RepID=B2JBE4_NOSP7|nr:KilA-N domain-containing protein [Nostoc punctiforme]ACC85248.1 hypothetical protein Npun_BF109 [Nostoc punctiforme PCC 73102]
MNYVDTLMAQLRNSANAPRWRNRKIQYPKGLCECNPDVRGKWETLGTLQRKSTKAYWLELSNDIGIPISSLIIEVEGRGSIQGTWVYPEVAIDLAQWVSIPFRIWANRTLMKVMFSSEVEQEPIPEQEKPLKALAPSHEAAQLALLVGEFAGLEKSLTAQLAVNAATKVNPALKPAADELKTAIAITNVSDDAYLKPTDIGKKVGMSAVAVNNRLVHAGLQYRTDDKKIPYRPTESGKEWGRMVSAVAKGSNQTVFQLRWLPTITQLFNERN